MNVPSAAAATRFVQQEQQQKVAYAVAGKALEQARTEGEAVQQLLDGAIKLNAFLGRGVHLDASA